MKIPTFEAQVAAGKALRSKVPRASHGEWRARRKGRDVVALIKAANRRRIPTLVPIRYARMLHSPFAFFRGAAEVMAFDLARTPVTGIRVQACGDAHLLNFGGFATPERHLVFDVNDFDETLPAPWEWDLKRLTASLAVAARGLKLAKARATEAVLAAAGAYRAAMASYAPMGAVERWYQRIDASQVPELHLALRTAEAPAHPVTAHLFPKFTDAIGAERRIRDEPPLVYHPRKNDRMVDYLRQFLVRYRQTLLEDRRRLLDRYQLVDVVLKVVGVGSVGRHCYVALLMAGEHDALFLQAKEAAASVLEPYAGRSRHANHGQRVVEGQRLMQSASDIFLGWSSIRALGRDFYIRQLRDCKTAARVEEMDSEHFAHYARHCGWALARAHAKAGDAAAISGYLGKSDAFDIAAARFAAAYAEQTEADFETLQRAAKAGLIPVQDV